MPVALPPPAVDEARDPGARYGHEGTIQYKRDANGLRGAPPDPHGVSVVTIGGGHADQPWIDEKETWQHRLESRAADERVPLLIANAGLEGLSSVDQVRVLGEWLPGIDGLFDPGGSNRVRVLLDMGVEELFVAAEAPGLFGGPKEDRAALLGQEPVAWGAQVWTDTPVQADAAALVSDRAEAWRVRLRGLLGQVEALGARPILVSQRLGVWDHKDRQIVGVARTFTVAGVPMNGVDLHAVMSAFNQVTMEVCAEAGGTCIDLAETCHLTAPQFMDWTHLDPGGADAFAACLLRGLDLRRPPLPRPGQGPPVPSGTPVNR